MGDWLEGRGSIGEPGHEAVAVRLGSRDEFTVPRTFSPKQPHALASKRSAPLRAGPVSFGISASRGGGHRGESYRDNEATLIPAQRKVQAAADRSFHSGPDTVSPPSTNPFPCPDREHIVMKLHFDDDALG